MKYLLLVFILSACQKTPSPEVFLEEFVKKSELQNVQIDSFKLLDKSCEDKKCTLSYSITYKTSADKKNQFETEVHKIAKLVFFNGKWLITEVNNVKTFHQSLEPINPLQ